VTKTPSFYTIRLKNIIDERLGVSEFVKPITHIVKVAFLSDVDTDSIYEYNFDEVFMRVPPFEPITIKPSRYGLIEFKGDYVWFATTIKGFSNDEKKLIDMYSTVPDEYKQLVPDIKCGEIICGEYEDIGTGIILRKLYVPRIIGDGEKWRKELRLKLTSAIPIRIIYGFSSETLKDWIKKISITNARMLRKDIIKKILSKPDEVLRMPNLVNEFRSLDTSSKNYSPTTLNYVSTCYGGTVISTDPFSRGRICDECRDNYTSILCRKVPGYGIYHWRRKAFPRVYTLLKNIATEYDIDDIAQYYRIPFVYVYTEQLRCFKRVEAFDISLDIGKLRLELEKPIVSEHFNTNGFLAIIDKQFVDVFIDVIKASNVNIACALHTCSGTIKISLINLLISKFLWRNLSMQQHDYDIKLRYDASNNELQPIVKIGRDEYVLSDHNAVSKLLNRIAGNREFRNFVMESLTHSLAHSIYIGLSTVIPYFDEYGAYISQTSKDYLVAGVIENTRGGSLKLLKPVITMLNHEKYYEDQTKGLAAFRPDATQKVLGEIINIITINREDAAKEVEEICKAKEENIESIAIAVTNRFKERLDQQSGSTKESTDASDVALNTLIEQIVNVVIEAFEDFVSKILNAGIYIDRYAFTSVILWKILRDASAKESIVDYVRHRIRKIGKYKHISDNKLRDLIDTIFDIMIEVEMSAIVSSILFPDYCSDGCETDLHLPRCIKALEQPYVISRCLLIAFLRFAGIPVQIPQLDINRFECDGSTLKNLSKLARSQLNVLTYVMDAKGIDILENLLKSNQSIKIKFEIDKRFREQNPDIVKLLEELKNKYEERFKVVYTQESHHGKMIVIDFLKVITSWNFGTGEKTKQLYSSELNKTLE
jgi:hypothetical protein